MPPTFVFRIKFKFIINMTVDPVLPLLLESRALAYDQLLNSLKAEDVNPKKKEEVCSLWSKSYQADFSKIKSAKETELPQIFGAVQEPEMGSSLNNSLARTGLGNRLKSNTSNSIDSYSMLDKYLAFLRNGSTKECIEWCLKGSKELKATENEKLLSMLINLELLAAHKEGLKLLDLASKLRQIRGHVSEILKVYHNFDVASLYLLHVMNKTIPGNYEMSRQRVIDQFSSLFMSCMNLPRHDIMKVRYCII